MAKNKFKTNILIRKRIRAMLLERGLRANPEAIKTIDDFASGQVDRMMESIHYHMRLEGRKTVKKKDILLSIDRLAKKPEYPEI